MISKYMLVFCLMLSIACYGKSKNPYDILRSIRSELRSEAAFDILNHDNLVSTAPHALQHIEQILVLSKELKDEALICTYYETRAHYYSLKNDRINEESTAYHQEALKYAIDHKLKFEHMRQLYSLGNYFMTYAKTGKAYTYFRQSLELLDEIGDSKIPNVWNYYNQMARYFYTIEEYDIVLDLLNKVLVNYLNNLKPREIFNALNTIGLVHLRKGDFKTSREYFDRVYVKSNELLDSAWMGIAQGNIGNIYMEQGDPVKAIEYFTIDYDYNSRPGGDLMSSLISLKKIAQMHYDLGDYPSALASISNYLDKMEVKPARYKDLAEAFALRLRLYESLNIYDKQLSDSKELNHYNSLYASLQNEQLLEKQRLVIEQDRYNQLRIDSEKSLTRLRVLVILFGFGIVILLVVYYRYLRKFKQSKTLVLASMGQLKGVELDSDMLVSSDIGKCERIDTSEVLVSSGDRLLQLAHRNLINKRNWQDFRLEFDQKKPGFFNKLKQDYPSLTESDCRLLALIELRLTNKELADTLSVTVEGIKKAKQRLKKKIQQSDFI